MEKWEIFQRKKSLEEKRIVLPNATVGKAYQVALDLEGEDWNEVVISAITGLEQTGLTYTTDSNTLSGIPLNPADINLVFHLLVAGEVMEKKVPFAVNPDPRSLWKTLESDKNDPWLKADEVHTQQPFGTKQLVAASKRGRAHANAGKFREDHYALGDTGTQGWNILAVSDGAGSARLSRLGSKVAAEAIVSHLKELPASAYEQLEAQLKMTGHIAKKPVEQELKQIATSFLAPAIHELYVRMETLAKNLDAELSDLHATLALCLIKQFDQGWAILTFSVGDCPIGLLNSKKNNVLLLNRLDSGEYGGATRFITMPEIFEQPDYPGRFSARIVPDFSYLMMMSDGIYDAKFETTFKLAQPEMWNRLIADLEGDNPEGHQLNLQEGNQNVAAALSQWMDFWSTGNHDDRTLVIIY
jgi:serine/threonine protein phosphatase PrpC